MAALYRRVDVLISVWAAGDHRNVRLVALGETALRLVRPLHRGTRAVALRQLQIVTHAEFITVTDHRRPGQREHQAVGEFKPSLIAVEHRRQAAANATVIELPAPRRPEGRNHRVALLFV